MLSHTRHAVRVTRAGRRSARDRDGVLSADPASHRAFDAAARAAGRVRIDQHAGLPFRRRSGEATSSRSRATKRPRRRFSNASSRCPAIACGSTAERLIVNDRPVAEPYVSFPDRRSVAPVTVPRRTGSTCSAIIAPRARTRATGAPIDESDVIGKALLGLWPPEGLAPVRSAPMRSTGFRATWSARCGCSKSGWRSSTS